ncbi:Fructosamine kinase-domain-containing protein [Apiospora marii]|uniref:Fructosamine kinase-domain-containing protein n=1 Tax=Apiospora marii TaxID=335849 RepID=UPI00313122A6
MSPQYWEVQNNAKVHEGDVELDRNIIAPGARIRSSRGHGASNWNTTARVDVEVGGESKSFFLKLTAGPKAQAMLQGEYESMLLINRFVPEFSPKPLAWGKCAESDRHFLLFEFHALQKGPLAIPRFINAVAQLHKRSRAAHPKQQLLPQKFGFHITTFNGTLAQDNTWAETWEEFYVRGMRRMLQLEEEAGGPCEELKRLSEPFLAKTGGRQIDPVLLHGDLWMGNVAAQEATGELLMFDSSAFWGHHECTPPPPQHRLGVSSDFRKLTWRLIDELATLRPLANDWA